MRNKIIQKIIILIVLISIILNLLIPVAAEAIKIFDDSTDFTFNWDYEYADGEIMAYGWYEPNNISGDEALPLIVWLHGSGEVGSSKETFKGSGLPALLNNWKGNTGFEGFNSYILCPHLGSGSWNTANSANKVEKLIQKFLDEYKVDVDNIVIVGHSLGGQGALYMAHQLDYFSKVVTLSPYNPGIALSEIDIPVIGYAGDSDDGSCISYIEGTFKSEFGEENVKILDGTSHPNVPSNAFKVDSDGNKRSDLVEWMFDYKENIDGQSSSGGRYSSNGEDIVSEMTGMDTITGLFVEPTVNFISFIVDAIMSIFSMVMTQSDLQVVMVDKRELSKLPELGDGNIGATYTIEDMTPYKNALGNINIKYPYFTYSAEETFSGNLDLLDINFIDDSNDDENWKQIRVVVSKWYRVLRMIAIIGLLSVLIYTGIKIIISSNSKDKAKHKEMLVNWFIAVILAFSMHYIMAFILSVMEELTSLLKDFSGVIQVTAGDTTFKTNLIGLARFQIQQQHFSAKIGNLIIYIALVTYTFKFTFIYFKRVLKMAFLTVISPIVALTYPIDKMEGRAKGFQFWISQYMYNALLQPFHYILYYVLVSTSLTLSVRNPIYAIAALMFMCEAEKLLKKIFGLENLEKGKEGSVGGIQGAFATGAITGTLTNLARNPMHPLQAIIGGGKSSSGKSSNKGSQAQTRNYYNDDGAIYGTREDTNIDDYLNTNTRQNNNNNSRNNNQTETTRMPLVDDFISRYRQAIPEESFEELSFNDGYGSMQSLMRRIEQCEERLLDPNLSEDEREILQQKLFKYKTALQNRLTSNEAAFNNFGIPLQYSDGDTRTNSELMNEIMKLRKLASDERLSERERDRYGAEYKKLFKKLKRRMSENEYIQKQGGIQALLEQERVRTLANTNYDENTREHMVNTNYNENAREHTTNGNNSSTTATRTNNPLIKNNENSMRENGQRQENNLDNTQSNNNSSNTNTMTQGKNVNNNNTYQRTETTTQTENKKEKRKQERRAIIENFKNARVTKGLTHVGKTIIKPAWDVEKSTSYNAERLVGNITKAVVGATIGIGAAAVQAGISITDGKYEAKEGFLTFGAGFVGATSLGKRAEGLRQTYREGAYSEEDVQSLEKYGEQWFNRDDIISNYNREFPGQGKAMRQRAVNNYVSRGITDFAEQKQAIKFAEQLKKERGMSEEQADWIAAGTLRYRQNLVSNNNYEILFDEKQRKKYLDTTVDAYTGSASKDSVRLKHSEFIQNVKDFDRANR